MRVAGVVTGLAMLVFAGLPARADLFTISSATPDFWGTAHFTADANVEESIEGFTQDCAVFNGEGFSACDGFGPTTLDPTIRITLGGDPITLHTTHFPDFDAAPTDSLPDEGEFHNEYDNASGVPFENIFLTATEVPAGPGTTFVCFSDIYSQCGFKFLGVHTIDLQIFFTGGGSIASSSVPEPGSWALLLTAIGAAGLARRKSRLN